MTALGRSADHGERFLAVIHRLQRLRVVRLHIDFLDTRSRLRSQARQRGGPLSPSPL